MSEINPEARLLIIDDCVANICLLKNILNRLGFANIETITDSREAVAKVKAFQPDLLLLDLEMPYIDGVGVIHEVAKASPGCLLPILVISGNVTAEAEHKALAAGATDFLTRPFKSGDVFMRIRNLLQLRFLHRQLEEQNLTLEMRIAARTRELRDAQRQIIAQERLRAFGEMAGGVVHDFNNALMSVIGYSEILLQDEEMISDPAMVRHFLTIMHTAGQDAAHVIGRLRDFYRPREKTDVFTPVDLNELAEQTVPLTQPKWKGQALADGRVIEVKLDLAKIPPISGDVAELREVVTNLIFNAVDAMPAGGTITLRSAWDGESVILEVIDTGTGMTDEVRNRCLEPFFSTKGEKGTGLGLSMVFGIIRRHEGSIELESEVGRGTTFRIRMPSQTVAPGIVLNEVPKLDRALTVLVVDDEPVTVAVLQKYLTSDGHTAVTARNPEEAMERIREQNFDLVITDQAMPGMNGTELAGVIRNMRSSQPIILVTGFGEGALGTAEQDADFDFVMRKPVQQRALRSALASLQVSTLYPTKAPPRGAVPIARNTAAEVLPDAAMP